MIQISVIMPVYNTPVPILKEAVDSILNQTFQDFEFIIIDDCSSDGSWEYLSSLRDSRIKLFRNTTNLGIAKTLNIGFRHAKGKYIARMDSDDVSMPDRLRRQFNFMERHPDVMVCGANTQNFGSPPNHVHEIG